MNKNFLYKKKNNQVNTILMFPVKNYYKNGLVWFDFMTYQPLWAT